MIGCCFGRLFIASATTLLPGQQPPWFPACTGAAGSWHYLDGNKMEGNPSKMLQSLICCEHGSPVQVFSVPDPSRNASALDGLQCSTNYHIKARDGCDGQVEHESHATMPEDFGLLICF
jgi:hypothetical protein